MEHTLIYGSDRIHFVIGKDGIIIGKEGDKSIISIERIAEDEFIKTLQNLIEERRRREAIDIDIGRWKAEGLRCGKIAKKNNKDQDYRHPDIDPWGNQHIVKAYRDAYAVGYGE